MPARWWLGLLLVLVAWRLWVHLARPSSLGLVLDVFRRYPGVPLYAADIARMAYCPPGRVYAELERLEQAGLIRSAPEADDDDGYRRRAYWLPGTPRPLPPPEHCAHCGRLLYHTEAAVPDPTREHGYLPLCHPRSPELLDCWTLVTEGGEPLGSRK